MGGFRWDLHRRKVLSGLLGTGVLLVPGYGKAATAAFVDELDEAAIRLKMPQGVPLLAMTFAGPRIVGVGMHGAIVYSDDNGATWSQAAVPVSVTLTSVAFATPMLGWAAGNFGVVMHTVDGGENWVVQLDGNQANQLTLAAARDPDIAQNSSPAAAFALKRAQVFASNGPSLPFLTLLVLSPQKVLVFGAYRMAMMSSDGGKTWADWSLHIWDRLSHNIYDAEVINSAVYLVGEDGLVFRSTDNNETYQPLPTPSATTWFGILGANDGSLIVYGVAGTAFRSADGGQSWTAINISTEDDLTCGCKLSTGELLLGGEGGELLLSKDNGATFTQLPASSSLSIFSMLETAGKNIILAGNAGILKLPSTVVNI